MALVLRAASTLSQRLPCAQLRKVEGAPSRHARGMFLAQEAPTRGAADYGSGQHSPEASSPKPLTKEASDRAWCPQTPPPPTGCGGGWGSVKEDVRVTSPIVVLRPLCHLQTEKMKELICGDKTHGTIAGIDSPCS